MKLYTYYKSSSAFRVRIALNHKNIPWKPVFVHLAKGEQHTDAHHHVNPMGMVPVLDTGQERLTQSMAIIEYLEDVHPTPALLPADPVERAIVRGMAQLIACEIQPLNNLRVLKYLKGPLGHDQDDVNTWYHHWIQYGFSALEKLIEKHGGAYAYGDTVSLVDVLIVPQVWNAERFETDLSAFPRIVDLDKRLRDLDAFRKALPENQPDAE